MGARSIGLILSGGGARGAYEVGALRYLADAFPMLLSRVRVITGSSVGAVNATFLASRGVTPESTCRLEQVWQQLDVDELLSISSSSSIRMLSSALVRFANGNARSPATGFLDVRPLVRLIHHSTNFGAIGEQIRAGRLDAVSIAGTDLDTGRTHLFTQAAKGVLRAPAPDSPFVPMPAALGSKHVLASAAMPLLFPPVRIDGRWYIDGGLRYNTPLCPALDFGADALIVITVHRPSTATVSHPDFPGIGQVLGKLLDSVFLDRVGFDLDRLLRINDFLRTLEARAPEQVAPFQQEMVRLGRRPYRVVPLAVVRPSVDLGALAAERLSQVRGRPLAVSRLLQAMFLDDEGRIGDAASFLFFDRRYASALIERGYADAEAARAEFLAL